MKRRSTPNPDPRALQALAEAAIYSVAEPDFTDDPDSAAEAAYAAIMWSKAIDRLILADGRFTDKDGRVSGELDKSHNDVNDRSCIVNRYGEDYAFEIGFDFALELGARLASNPIGIVEVADLFETARERVADRLRRHRDRLWSDMQRRRSQGAP